MSEDLPQSIEPLDNKVCDLCLERNLIDKSEGSFIQKCPTCDEGYCIHHASSVDPLYCVECLHDVQVTIETVRRTVISENASTGQVTTRSRKARQITLAGSHWLFNQRKIVDMTDLELTLAIEYHETFLHSLVYERDLRRIEKFHRNADKPFKVKTSNSTITSTIKKTKTIKAKTPDTAEANIGVFIEQLKASGMSLADIKAMMMSGAKKK